MRTKSHVEKRIKQIKRRTRRRYNTEEKIRIVLEGIKGESSIAENVEIIRLVEESDLSVKRTLDRLGISRSTF